MKHSEDVTAVITERQVHNHLASITSTQDAYISAREALMAVLEKCEQMRAETANTPGGVGRFLAEEFETVIARSLNLIN